MPCECIRRQLILIAQPASELQPVPSLKPAILAAVVALVLFVLGNLAQILYRHLDRKEDERARQREREAEERRRTLDNVADLQELLLDVMSETAEALAPEDFIKARKRWSRAARKAMPELEPSKRDSQLRNILNRVHEDLLAVEDAWVKAGEAAGRHQYTATASLSCGYAIKSFTDYRRTKEDPRAWGTTAKQQATASAEYWRLP